MSLARPPHAQSAWLVLVGAVLASLLIGAAAVSVARADDGTETGTGLSVEVLETTASASPTPTPSKTVGGVSTTDSGTGGGTTGGGTTTEPGSTTSTTVTVESGVAGVLYVSGLSWTYTPSLNPLDGSLNLRFTVRNVFSETLSPTATLWINQIFGGPVDQPVVVAVEKLKSGETRTVEATFHGLAQWTVLSGHGTLSVPSKGEVVLAPIARDAMIWFLPWFIVLLGALGAAAILWRRLRPRRPVPAMAAYAPESGLGMPEVPDDALGQGQGSAPGAQGPTPTTEAP